MPEIEPVRTGPVLAQRAERTPAVGVSDALGKSAQTIPTGPICPPQPCSLAVVVVVVEPKRSNISPTFDWPPQKFEFAVVQLTTAGEFVSRLPVAASLAAKK